MHPAVEMNDRPAPSARKVAVFKHNSTRLSKKAQSAQSVPRCEKTVAKFALNYAQLGVIKVQFRFNSGLFVPVFDTCFTGGAHAKSCANRVKMGAKTP
jgi:hypothetical protein